MRTGVRLTCLKNGDALLGEVWIYKELSGEDAIKKKLEDLFFHINKLKFTDVIDTIQINKNSSNRLYIGNSGVNGDLWPFEDRIASYYRLVNEYKLNLILEIEFPTVVTAQNLNDYAVFATEVINAYPWVKYWQIMTEPESRDAAGMQKCPPNLYVRLIKYIHETIHTKYNDIKIGGPSICNAVSEYINSEFYAQDGSIYHTGWLATATGEYYGIDPNDSDIGPSGFLKYIDFFAFQGRQNYTEMNYNIFPGVVEKLRKGLITQAQRDNYNLDLEFLSTYQGHEAEISNYSDMQLQAYRDLREFVNDFKANVIPFKTQLVDEFYDPDNPALVKNSYGILHYFLGNNHKPAYDQYKFLLNKLETYTQLADNTYYLNNKRPFILADNLHYIMLMNADKSMMGTVIFPSQERNVLTKNPTYVSVTLKPAANRSYYLPDGKNGTVSVPIDVVFKTYDFVFVEESVALDTSVDDSVLKEAKDRIELYSNFAKEMMEMIPDDYVKDVYDGMNFPKLVRALAIEQGDLEYERQILEDNMYLKTAHGDAIYNNFGAVIKMPWRNDWNEEKYRLVVSSLIESLLKGATKSSVAKCLSSYTTFDVKIYELFKDYKHYGLTKDSHYQNQYSFVVEIEKDLDSGLTNEKLYDDTRMLVDIVRPAHTIPIIMVVLVGKEDYGDWYENKYGVPWKDSDVDSWIFTTHEEANIFGWKSTDYPLAFTNNVDKLNSTKVIGPKYTLHDNEHFHLHILNEEVYDKAREELYINFYAYYEEQWEKQVQEEQFFNAVMTFVENKFGVRPLTNTLITNIGNLWGNDYVPTRKLMFKSRTVMADSDDNDFVTGFEYLLDDSDEYHLKAVSSENFPNPKEQDDVLIQVSEHEEYPMPEEEMQVGYAMQFTEFPFKYRWEDLLRTNGYLDDTCLNLNKTAIAPRLFDDDEMYVMLIEHEKFPTPTEDIISINSAIQESEEYYFKDEQDSLDLSCKLREISFKYRDDNALRTFFDFSRALNTSKTAIADRQVDDISVQSVIIEEHEEFETPQEEFVSSISEENSEEYHFKEEHAHFNIFRPFEEQYKFDFTDALITNITTTNSSVTAVKQRTQDSCSFKLYRLENNEEIIIQEGVM